MFKYLLIALILVNHSVVSDAAPSSSDVDAYRTLKGNFTYQAEPEGQDVWQRFDITEKHTGDCEDFAFSLQGVIGGSVMYATVPGYGAHAMLVKDGYVYETLSDGVYQVTEWTKRGTILVSEMVFEQQGVK